MNQTLLECTFTKGKADHCFTFTRIAAMSTKLYNNASCKNRAVSIHYNDDVGYHSYVDPTNYQPTNF